MGTNKGISKLLTGIEGFDELFSGGIPKGRSLLVSGSTGTGKTILLLEFLYRGLKDFDQNGVYVTFEEKPKDLLENVKSMGWIFDPFIKKGKMAFVDASPEVKSWQTSEQDIDYVLTPLLVRIRNAIKKTKAKRLVIDGISWLFAKFSNKDAVRMVLYQICVELKKQGITSLISGEKMSDDAVLSRFGVEEFVLDGVLELSTIVGQQRFIRRMFVRKLRGTGYRSGEVNYNITNKGIVVYPKIPVSELVAKTSFKERQKFGIKGLDQVIEGGIPKGHVVLVSGNTGTGKTLFGMKFLMELFLMACHKRIPQKQKTRFWLKMGKAL